MEPKVVGFLPNWDYLTLIWPQAEQLRLFNLRGPRVNNVRLTGSRVVSNASFPRRKKNIRKELGLNPGPHSAQMTALTTKVWFLGHLTLSFC